MIYKIKINSIQKIEIPISINFDSFGLEDNLNEFLENSLYPENFSENKVKKVDSTTINFFLKKPASISEDYKQVVSIYQNKEFYNSFYSKIEVSENINRVSIINNNQFFYKNNYNLNAYKNIFFRLRFYSDIELNNLINEELIYLDSKFVVSESSDLPLVLSHENSVVYGNSFIKTEFFNLKIPRLIFSSEDGYYFLNKNNNQELYLKIELYNPLQATYSSFTDLTTNQDLLFKIEIDDSVRFLQFNNGNWVLNDNYNLYEI